MKQDISIQKVKSRPFKSWLKRVTFTALCVLLMNSWLVGQETEQPKDSVRVVKGIILDAKTKEPIVAAQLNDLYNLTSSLSDFNGEFEISIKYGTEVIVVNGFDYNEQEVAVRNRDSLVIYLYPEVFTSHYGTVDGIKGSERISKLSNSYKSLTDLDPLTFSSVEEKIQSQAGGDIRTINRSATTGIGANMFIRGFNSLNANAQPLIVVDGVIWNSFRDVQSINNGYFTNVLNDIDVSDIESVNIIKDGTVIYGSKASNGVILIKTKRGKSMATKIELNSLYGMIEKPSSLPVMNKGQYRLYTGDLLGSMNKEQVDERFNMGVEELPFFNDDQTNSSYKLYHNTTDWDKEVYEEGNFQSHNISVNGGDDMALYHFSMGYTGSKAVIKESDMQRLNARFNTDISLNKNIDLAVNMGFVNTDRNLMDDGIDFYTSPSYLAMIKAPFLSPYKYTVSGTLTSDVEDSDIFGVGNPTAIKENSLNTSKHYRFNMGMKPVFRVSPKVTISSQFDYSLDKVKETYYSPLVGVADRYIDGFGISENMFRNQQMRNQSIFSDSRVSFADMFSDLHSISAVAGVRYSSDNYESDFGEGHNSGSDQKRNLLTEEYYRSLVGINNQIVSMAGYASVDYIFTSRYFVSASVSVDGSSRFGNKTKEGFQMANKSWGVFPSIQGSWLISSEGFMKNVNFVNQLKLKGGFEITGNDDIDPYAWTAYFTPVRYMNRANGIVLDNIGNSELQWETTQRINVGIEALILNNRLALTLDAYKGQTSNLLMLKSLPEIVGTGYYWANEGELSNMGIEASANWKILNIKNVKWEFGASVGHYTNEVEKLPAGDYITNYYGANILTSEGNAAGVFYGYKTKGVFATDAAASSAGLKMFDTDGIEHAFGAGDMHFDDKSNDKYIDEKDMQIIGDPNPDIYGSFNTKLTVKNFSLNTLFTFSYGNDVYNALRANLESGSNFINQSSAMTNRWFYEGQQTSIPKIAYGDPMGNARFSDRWIEDGSYIRLKSLILNYKVPLKGGIIEGLNIWVSGNNLWTGTKYLGRDPEFSGSNRVLYQGVDTGLLPHTRSYYVGIKMNL